MKLLHTADLHLGKTLHETSLISAQEKMLNDIHRILIKERYAALLISGDIYDRSIPPAEAVSLFSTFLTTVRTDCPKTAIFIIPGNHDSAQRLAFADDILKNQAIYIAKNTEQLEHPISITQDGEKIEIFLLPFLNFGIFSPEQKESAGYPDAGNSQAEMAAVASALLKKAVNPAVPAVLLAHLFTTGGSSSSSERTFIGTAEYVDPSLFSFFTYTALGHLHRCQKVTDRMYYSGSPLPYAFDEADDKKCVLSVDIRCNEKNTPVHIERIPIIPERKMARLEGTFEDFFNTAAYDAYKEDFLEITLTDSAVITNPMQLLRRKFPFTLSVRQNSFMEQKTETLQTALQTVYAETADTLIDNFTAFESLINNEITAEKKKLFASFCKGAENET